MYLGVTLMQWMTRAMFTPGEWETILFWGIQGKWIAMS